MVNWKKWWKILWIIPITILFSLNSFLSEPSDIQIGDRLLTSIFGQITMQDRERFVFVIENLYYLLLFNLLFGTYIYEDFQYSSVYLFTRLKKRSYWLYKKGMEIVWIALLYSTVFVGINLMVCMINSTQSFDVQAFYTFVILCFKITMLLVLTTVLINVLALVIGSTRGFIAVYIGAVLLIFAAIKHEKIPILGKQDWILAINPFSGILSEMMERPMLQVLVMVFHVFLIAIVVFLSAVYLEQYDIALKDTDND